MDGEDREKIGRALARIPREEWELFLASDDGHDIARARDAVRGALRGMGRLPPGPPPSPIFEAIDVLGHRPHEGGGGPAGVLLSTRDEPGGALNAARVAKLIDEVILGDWQPNGAE